MKLPEVEYERFFDVSLDMLCISSYDGHFKKVNPNFEEVLGFSSEELCTKSYLDFIHPDDIEATIKEVEKQLFSKQHVLNFENRYRCKDGSYKWLSWKSAPVGDFMYAAARDITESKKTKDALEIANRELELFSYSVAHDLRAPVRSILGFTTLILEETKSSLSPEAESHLKRVIAAGTKMGILIEGLLNLSRLAKRNMELQLVDLSKMVEEITRDIQSSSPQRQVNFVIAKDIEVYGDKTLLKIALENMISNSWKYTSKSSHQVTIEFGVTKENSVPVFFIKDNGVGFDMKYADKLFGIFQRLHSEKEFEGTGVGLVTVQRIIQRHDGKIWAKGQVGEGASFYFILNS